MRDNRERARRLEVVHLRNFNFFNDLIIYIETHLYYNFLKERIRHTIIFLKNLLYKNFMNDKYFFLSTVVCLLLFFFIGKIRYTPCYNVIVKNDFSVINITCFCLRVIIYYTYVILYFKHSVVVR